MSPTVYSNEFPHLNRMMEIKQELSLMNIFKVFNIKYWQLKREYRDLEIFGFNLGWNIALKELEKAGFIKELE